MSLPVQLHPLAEVDVVGAWEWYEQQETGLGDRFLAAVHAAIVWASRWPNTGSPVGTEGGDIVERKVAAAGFPYAIRYRVRDGQLFVMAVYHQHRRPGYGADRP